MLVNGVRAIFAARLNASQRSRVGVAVNTGSVSTFIYTAPQTCMKHVDSNINYYV